MACIYAVDILTDVLCASFYVQNGDYTVISIGLPDTGLHQRITFEDQSNTFEELC